MAKSIEEILGWVYLSGLVEAVKTGIPKVVPEAFWSTKSETIADSGRYTRVKGTRKVSKRVEYGAPSRQVELKEIGSFDVKLVHTFEHIALDVKTYQALRNYTDYRMQEMGRQEVDRQAVQARARIDNLRVAALYSMLANGAIWFDGDGNLLPSSSGAVVTVDYNVPAAHKNQLGGIIAASWATATTDIPLHIRKIKKQALKETGYEPTHAFYGENIVSYMQANNFVKDWFIRNPAKNDEFMNTGELPRGFLGIDQWIPVYKAFYEDNSSVNQEFFGADAVTFTPGPDKTWYEFMAGTYPVPKSFQPSGSAQGAMGDFELKTGMFAYAKPIDDPMTAKIYNGDTQLPITKNPDVLWLADVTP